MDEFEMGKPEENEEEKPQDSTKDINKENDVPENDEKKKKHLTPNLGQIEEDDERVIFLAFIFFWKSQHVGYIKKINDSGEGGIK